MEPTLSPLGPWKGRDPVSPEGWARDGWKHRSCGHVDPHSDTRGRFRGLRTPRQGQAPGHADVAGSKRGERAGCSVPLLSWWSHPWLSSSEPPTLG